MEKKESWIEEFDKNFTLQENGCSDCITESLFYKGKPCYDLNELKAFISKTISQEKEKCIKEEVFAFMRHLQEKANTLPPNLLLNEVVNYAYDRVNLLQNK